MTRIIDMHQLTVSHIDQIVHPSRLQYYDRRHRRIDKDRKVLLADYLHWGDGVIDAFGNVSSDLPSSLEFKLKSLLGIPLYVGMTSKPLRRLEELEGSPPPPPPFMSVLDYEKKYGPVKYGQYPDKRKSRVYSESTRKALSGPTLEDIAADPSLQGIQPVNIDPVSMAVEGIVDMLDAGKSFTNNPTLGGVASIAVSAIPGRYAEKIVDELPLKKLDNAMAKSLRTMKRFKVPCFKPGPDIKKSFKGRERELESHFARQLKHQEAGLNDLTVGEYIENRNRYEKMRRAKTGMAQDESRNQFSEKLNMSLLANYKLKLTPREAKKAAKKRTYEIMDNLAALHDPDMIAGGKDKVNRMGNKQVNASIGAQWRHKSRLTQMDEQAQRALERLGPEAKMNVSLKRCPLSGK
ncbi:polymorphic toxin type 15 domain-containing protein [Vibrio neptunius]|uniref:polymorphic toxin type 15 domain-containing protein n=1 Tax=Vibrio neptunius TaxID=170651 RepID=UPI003CE47425